MKIINLFKSKKYMKINVNGVSITLTKDQLKEIDKQVRNIKTIDDINSYEDACKILNQEIYSEEDYMFQDEWYNHQLKTIIKAVNYVDNDNKIYKHNFNDSNITKYILYFKKVSSGWSVTSVTAYYFFSYCSVGFYYKKKESAEIISKKFIDLYNLYLG